MKLITPRLILRDWQVSDKKDLIENINDIEVSKWLIIVPHPYTESSADLWINHCGEQKGKQILEKTSHSFAIQLKDGSTIGGINIDYVDHVQGRGMIGYWLGIKYHKQGYGSEALGKIIDFAFNVLKLRRLEAGVLVGNTSSGKLLEKFGFKKEGIKRKACIYKADGKIKDEYIYGLLSEEYGGEK
jgi:ribosomal-protein-alanine N-acetyltransferase